MVRLQSIFLPQGRRIAHGIKVCAVDNTDGQGVVIEEPEVAAFHIAGRSTRNDGNSDFLELGFVDGGFALTAGLTEVTHDNTFSNTSAEVTGEDHQRLVGISGDLDNLNTVGAVSIGEFLPFSEGLLAVRVVLALIDPVAGDLVDGLQLQVGGGTAHDFL